MARLQDKITVITSSDMGLGQAMAFLFSREGARVVIIDINETAGQETIRQIR